MKKEFAHLNQILLLWMLIIVRIQEVDQQSLIMKNLLGGLTMEVWDHQRVPGKKGSKLCS